MEWVEISTRGTWRRVPAVSYNGNTIVCSGRFVRTATFKDEFWLEFDPLGNPEEAIRILKQSALRADFFHFSQRLPAVEPSFGYYHEKKSVAAIPLTSYDDWWNNRVTQVTRKNIRRAARRGLVVRPVGFDDHLVGEIVKINNETPIRSGRRFWHYQKPVETVKKDYSDFLDRSEFLGAFSGGELVGFLRLIYSDQVAHIIQLLCLNSHHDKRPANALISGAVEKGLERGKRFLTYGQYIYHGNADSPLTEFKRRNGFEQILLPSYYVPLTFTGRTLLHLKLHKGIRDLVPKGILSQLKRCRALWQGAGSGNAADDRSD